MRDKNHYSNFYVSNSLHMTVYVFVNHREIRMIYPALTAVKPLLTNSGRAKKWSGRITARKCPIGEGWL